MSIRRLFQVLALLLVVASLAGCVVPPAPQTSTPTVPATDTPMPATDTPVAATPSNTPTGPTATATTAPQSITIDLPQAGATITSPVTLQGSVTVTPFEATLRGRVYDGQGNVVGQQPIHVDGELGQPGVFTGTIPFTVSAGGEGRVEVAELSAKDGSVLASASVTVTLAASGGAATHQAEFGGVSFSFGDAVAQGAQGQLIAAVPADPNGPFWDAAPEHVEFTFSSYVLTDTFHQPRIIVYPIADFLSMSPPASQVITGLQQLLTTQPLSVTDNLPFLPLFNAAQQLHAAVKYVQFQGGVGVRYLTQFNQYAAPVNNHDLFYTFQGVTLDGKYYVAAILPVNNPILPADNSQPPQGTPEEITKYYIDMAQKLTEQAPSTFTPDLGALDALVSSIAIR